MMLRYAIIAAVFAVVATATVPAVAQTTDGAFQIMKATENKVWRLNTQTGEIAVCSLDGENLICTTSSDAAMVPAKTFEEVEAERAAATEAAEQQQAAQREEDLQMLDRILQLIREFIGIAMGQNQG